MMHYISEIISDNKERKINEAELKKFCKNS